MRNIYFLDKDFKDPTEKPEMRRALLLSKREWSKLGDHLTKSQKIANLNEQRRLEEERRKELSKEMAKTWDNTLINMRRRRLEKRRERAEKVEDDRKRRYFQMRQEEQDLKKKISDEAKEMMRRDKDNAKKLTSALRFCEVLREREEQVKFEKKLKELEVEREVEFAEKIKEDVNLYKEEQKALDDKDKEKKKNLSIEAKEQFKQFFERRRIEEEKRIEQERLDNINIVREIEHEKKNAKMEAERKKMLIMDDVMENRKMIEDFRNQKMLEDEEEDNAVKIHAAAKKKIAFIRRKKEFQMRDEAQKRRDKISDFVSNEEAERDAFEEACLKKALSEKERKEEEVRKEKKDYKERLLNELKQEREDFLKREEERVAKESEELKWDIMQRFKQNEENQEFFRQVKLKHIQKQEDNRAMWDKQCREKQAVNAEEREQDINAVQRAVQWWKGEDKDFLDYAENLLQESKKKGRPLLPMIRCIEQYKKENNLVKPPPQHKTWKSNVPIDSVSKKTQTKGNSTCPKAKLIKNCSKRQSDNCLKRSCEKSNLKELELLPKCCTEDNKLSNNGEK